MNPGGILVKRGDAHGSVDLCFQLVVLGFVDHRGVETTGGPIRGPIA
jgi:hypothetical protein